MILVWLVVLAGFGVFAPKVESVLAGAGWQDSTSQSVQARQIIERDFAGLGSSALQVVVVDRGARIAGDPSAQAVISRVEAMLRASKDVSVVVPPTAGSSVSADDRTAVVVAGAAAGTNQLVTAAADLAGPLARLGTGQEMGVILAVAVALDALAVRLVLIPALLAITRHAAWYQPKWLARILPKVRFSH